MASQITITQLLTDLKEGRREALDELFPLVYGELRRIAHYQMSAERAQHTLNTTGLIHEAYLKLVNYNKMDWQSRAHFCAVAAGAMRNVLVSYARRHKAEKRGGGAVRTVIDDEFGDYSDQRAEEIVFLDEALQQLEAINPRHVRIVECRFFGGLTIEETAESLGISTNTVTRDWRMARAWLKDALSDNSKAD